MYSASVVDKAVRVCILEEQVTGHPAYVIAQPDCDLVVVGSCTTVQ